MTPYDFGNTVMPASVVPVDEPLCGEGTFQVAVAPVITGPSAESSCLSVPRSVAARDARRRTRLLSALVVIPAYNEEKIIRQTVVRVVDFLRQQRGENWRLLVAENGSQDKTVDILNALSVQYPAAQFRFQSFGCRSKSGAIKQAWLAEDADVYIHLDADLSTDLSNLPVLLDGICEGCDIVIGSRYLAESDADRSSRRNLISRGYNFLLRCLFSLDVRDSQCGFKAVSRRARDEIVRRTRHLSEGFMDTEMLIVASAKGFRIKEVPIRWRDERKSKFNSSLVALRFLLNMLLVKLDLLRGRYD